MNDTAFTVLGGVVGVTIGACIQFLTGRKKATAETQSIYITSSDMLVENLTQEVSRLHAEVQALHSEVVLLRQAVRSLGGDPEEIALRLIRGFRDDSA